MKHLVVGVDGSAESDVALSWAISLATSLDAQVTVVSAYQPVGSEVRPTYAERVQDEHQRRLEGFCGSRLEGVRHHIEAINGDPRDVLPRVARDRDADLLVVASVGGSGHRPGFLAVGSVVEYLAHHLDQPLAVITPGAVPTVDRILVAVDGSPHSIVAVEWVRRLVDHGVPNASLTAVAVGQPGLAIAPDASDAEWDAEAQRTITTKWAAPLSDAGESFTAVAVPESPVAEAILDTAEEVGADLVVLGARGLGGVTGLRIGGVALKVLHRTVRPLVLVPDDRDR